MDLIERIASLPAWASAIAMLLGAGILAVSIRSGWKNAVNWALAVFTLVGGLMVLSPRWTEISVRAAGWELKIAELERENAQLRMEASAVQSELELVRTAFAGEAPASVWVEAIKKAYAETSGQDDLDGKFWIANASGSPAVETFANELGVTPIALQEALVAKGAVLATPASQSELEQVPASNLVFGPGLAGQARENQR